MSRDLVTLARQVGATVVEASDATIIVIARPVVAERLDVAAVAKLGSCTPRRVREAARSGELPGAELGERALSFARVDVLAWLESHPIRVRTTDESDEVARDVDARIRAGAK